MEEPATGESDALPPSAPQVHEESLLQRSTHPHQNQIRRDRREVLDLLRALTIAVEVAVAHSDQVQRADQILEQFCGPLGLTRRTADKGNPLPPVTGAAKNLGRHRRQIHAAARGSQADGAQGQDHGSPVHVDAVQLPDKLRGAPYTEIRVGVDEGGNPLLHRAVGELFSEQGEHLRIVVGGLSRNALGTAGARPDSAGEVCHVAHASRMTWRVKFLSIVGARPQFVKLAPISGALRESDHEHVVLHTGQHYDANLSSDLFTSLNIPEADIHLDIGSGSHGQQTGSMLVSIEKELLEQRPEVVLVYGDTNSTLAGTLAATKLLIPVAHVEAGLRSFNRDMPEEQNRLVADHLSDILLAPTATAMQHLDREGLSDRAHLVGDVMTDVCLRVAAKASGPPPLPPGIRADNYVIATIHRPSNTDDPERLAAIIRYLERIPADVVLAAHPRLVAKAREYGVRLAGHGIHVREPFDYPALVSALSSSAGVVTDSGGLQKEAYLLGRPCTTLRAETEWTETLTGGHNVLDQDLMSPHAVVRGALESNRPPYFGDGASAQLIVSTVATEIAARAV